jgi:small subunit ribosomal protein S27Ae
MGKARVDFYSAKGETLTRTHHSCPKCGPGIFLAEHASRRSCGRCGYMETKSASESKPESKPTAPKGKGAPKAGGAPTPAAPKSPAPPAASA